MCVLESFRQSSALALDIKADIQITDQYAGDVSDSLTTPSPSTLHFASSPRVGHQTIPRPDSPPPEDQDTPLSPLSTVSGTPITPHPINHTLFGPSADDASPSPTSLYFDPDSRSARVKRTEKLSQFFGEPIDLTSPPRLLTPAKSKKEVVNDVFGDVWRAFQAEGKRGKLRGVEM